MGDGRRAYLRGVALSALGMVVISPDGLLMRLLAWPDPWTVAFYRSGLGGVSLLILLFVQKRGRVDRLFAGLGAAGLVSAALMAVSNISFVIAITHTTVANTLLLVATLPLFSALLGRLLIGEAVRPATWAAILLAGAGVVVIFAGSVAVGGGTDGLFGDLMALVAALMMSLNLVLLRRFGLGSMLGGLCLAGFLGAGVAALAGGANPVAGNDLLILGYMGLIMLPLAFVLFFAGTASVPAAEVALLALVETVLGPLWVWLGVGEAPAPVALAGGLLVIGAIVGNAAWSASRRSPVL